MNAADFLKARYQTSHTLPVTVVIDLMEEYLRYKNDSAQKKKEEFNSEVWLSQINLTELRKLYNNKK